MKKFLNAFLATLFSLASSLSLASGDSGTSSMSELNLTGIQFLMLLGGVAVLGVVIWLVVKLMNK